MPKKKPRAKKVKAGPLTVARKRAVITPLKYDGSRMPKPYISTILNDADRATKVRMISMSKPYVVACQMAAAAGVDSPSLATWDVLEQWSNHDQIKVVQEAGHTAMIERSAVEALVVHEIAMHGVAFAVRSKMIRAVKGDGA